jgi:Flp pilus assembly protein TadG
VEPLRDRPWFIVKIILLVLLGVVLVISAIDAFSIVQARSKLLDATKTAATAAATSYKADHDIAKACDAAKASIKAAAPDVVLRKHFCQVSATDGSVTIITREDAGTILLGKIPFVRRVTLVREKSTSSAT